MSKPGVVDIYANKITIIGDLHGRLDSLKRIIGAVDDQTDFYVFIGDLIHKKKFYGGPTVNTFEMLKYVRVNMPKPCVWLMGNNEYSILSHLMCPQKQIKKKELRESLKLLWAMPESLCKDWVKWLDRRPHIARIMPMQNDTDYSNRLIICAHAYPGITIEECVFGPKDTQWYTQESAELLLDNLYSKNVLKSDRIIHDLVWTKPEIVFGHYGIPYISKEIKCIDATNFNGVGVYNTYSNVFQVFS